MTQAINDISNQISETCCEEIRRTIAGNNGHEVFFIGHLDKNLVVVNVEACAFGNENAVPAVLQRAQPGDVVIHNHPDGPLKPSDADIGFSSTIGSMNIGSYIVNNSCTCLQIVVKPIAEKKYKRLSIKKITSWLIPEGKIACALPDYEYRTQQIDMTTAVCKCFNENLLGVVEAGTGTGKSLSYLIPSAIWATSNKERVVVSTNTINLQEQLVNKDIPLLNRDAGLAFTSELMKGRNNYVCLRKINALKDEGLVLEDPRDRKHLEALINWTMKTSDGTLADMNVTPPMDVWERVRSDQDSCKRIECKNYEKCFFYMARRGAARANIIVVNHHLLMADLALRKQTMNYTAAAVLPPFNRLVIDEAHNLEDVATSYFSIIITRLGLRRRLSRLVTAKPGDEKGLLPLLAKNVFAMMKIEGADTVRPVVVAIKNDLIVQSHTLADTIDLQFETLTAAFIEYIEKQPADVKEETKVRITSKVSRSAFWNTTVRDSIRHLSSAIVQFITNIKKMVGNIGEFSPESQDKISDTVIDIKGVATKLAEVVNHLNFFFKPDEAHCRWIEYEPRRRRRESILRLCVSPIDLSNETKEAIFDTNKTVVMTSATLAVGDSFDFFQNRTGLNQFGVRYRKLQRAAGDAKDNPVRRLLLMQLDTPFHFETQALVCVPIDIPEPVDERFPDALEKIILKSLVISDGGAFVLFTSYRLLNQIYNRLSPTLRELGYMCLKQGEENRHMLLQKFARDYTSILFATSSFWEGVDVKGESLRSLILTRLPFRVPTEPLLKARAEYLQKQGKDPFWEIEVPHAVIKFKQGFGRLIRNRSDRGVVLILDTRVFSRSYGKSFLDSLPTKKILHDTSGEVLRAMKGFFAQE